MTTVAVFENKFVRSWPALRKDRPLRLTDRGYELELGRALERKYSTDAHFSAYQPTTGQRLNHKSLTEGVAATLTVLVFDVDGPDHRPSEDWRRGQRLRVMELDRAHPGAYFYETKGGCRIVYRLPEPTTLQSRDDAQQWARDYMIAIAYLGRRFDIEADPACNDWQRLFRLPRATRGGKLQDWFSWGDPHNIGSLVIEPTAEDIAKAKESKAFDRKQVREFVASCAGSGSGLLFHLLDANNDVLRDHGDGAWVVRCPNEREHTSGRTGDGSTLLYPPDRDGEIGCIHCLHAHCHEFRLRDWLRFFTDGELETARTAAGIQRDRSAA